MEKPNESHKDSGLLTYAQIITFAFLSMVMFAANHLGYDAGVKDEHARMLSEHFGKK